MHAADVMLKLASLLEMSGVVRVLIVQGRLRRSTSDFKPDNGRSAIDGNIALLAVVLAAAVHDFEHPGFSNNFMVQIGHDIAFRFNDQHVIENHSLFRALDLMRNPAYNFDAEMRPSQRFRLRQKIITLVLSTDMSRHFEFMTTMKSKVLGDPAVQAAIASRPPAIDRQGSVVGSPRLPPLPCMRGGPPAGGEHYASCTSVVR